MEELEETARLVLLTKGMKVRLLDSAAIRRSRSLICSQGMTMIRLSANLGFLWTELPLLQRVEAAAKAGFRAVEFHWPYDVPAHDLKAVLDRTGLKALALNTSMGPKTGIDFGLGAVPGRQADFQAAVEQALDYGAAIGAGAVHAMAGVVPANDKAAATGVFVENLLTASDKAAKRNMTILLEGLNQRDRPGHFFSTLSEGASIIARTGRSNIMLMADIYHMGVAEGDILTKLERYLPVIGHVQIAAVPSRREPDEGEIHYPAIFARLEALGYQGWVGCEYRPRTTTEAGLGWVKAFGLTF